MAAQAPTGAQYRYHLGVALPDVQFTPGITRPVDANTVCHTSTKDIRKPGIQGVYKEYGAVKSPGKCCEIDHLIPLELGGDNGLENEWPQPYEPRPGAHEKDILENYLHKEVCAGRMALTDAQTAIRTDWYQAYLNMTQPSGENPY